MGHSLKKCPRANGKYSSDARDNGGLIRNDGDQDGEVDELRSEVCVNADRIPEWRDIEDESKEDG